MSEMDNQFHAFKEFLLKLVPEEDKSQFRNNRYLSYSRFTTLYKDSYLKDSVKAKYSAEESWFTIITWKKRRTKNGERFLIAYLSLKSTLQHLYCLVTLRQTQCFGQQKI